MPSRALASMDCDASVMTTTHSGSERPATKKFTYVARGGVVTP